VLVMSQVLESGIVYDKAAIQKHLASGDHTCPVTGQSVRPDVLVSLPSLKRDIAEWQSASPEGDTLVSVSVCTQQQLNCVCHFACFR
jgi:hypothetical protein